jgi:hypothetical protein
MKKPWGTANGPPMVAIWKAALHRQIFTPGGRPKKAAPEGKAEEAGVSCAHNDLQFSCKVPNKLSGWQINGKGENTLHPAVFCRKALITPPVRRKQQRNLQHLLVRPDPPAAAQHLLSTAKAWKNRKKASAHGENVPTGFIMRIRAA